MEWQIGWQGNQQSEGKMQKNADGDAFEDIICSDSQIVNEETANIQSVKLWQRQKKANQKKKQIE